LQTDGFTIPVSIDRFTVLAALLAILGLAAFVSGVVDLARQRKFRFFRLGGSLMLLLCGLVVFAIAGWAQTYRALTHNELVAHIQAAPLVGQPQTMSVTYTPVRDGQDGVPLTYSVKGDEWLLGGDVLKWQDYLNIMGVNTGYRITRLQGLYQDANDERTKEHTAYNLGGTTSNVYTFLKNHATLAPFVRAVYGNYVAMLPAPGVTYNVYVSTSGYWTAAR